MTDGISLGLRARVALEAHGFRAAHSLGQNFILDEDFLSHLLDLAGVEEGDSVLEIGPGPGLMTALLAERAAKVVAVELDEKLRPVLESVIGERENAELVFTDALRCDLSALVAEKLGAPWRAVANLPYYITADLILKLFEARPLPESVCLMVQREAAERLMSEPGDKNWCALAATVRFYGDCEILENVPPQHFEPAPHVDSCFIRIDVKQNRLVPESEEAEFLKLVRCCFHMRRKTLANNLKAVYGMSGEQAAAMIEAAGFNSQVRGEALSLEEVLQLFEAKQR